ncbi:MAG: CRISPR-associated protein Csx20 [Candidatus Helarchaeota archaeon]
MNKKRMLLLLSHELTEEQIADARNSLSINEFITLTPMLRELWRAIPPTLSSINNYIIPIYEWVEENGIASDYILIHGDFGAVYLLVNFAFLKKLIPVHSTTERKVIERVISGNIIKSERVFKHTIFRKYEKGMYYE